MSKQQQSIEERINNALSAASTGAATLTELIEETELVIKQASETAEQEAARARDLTCTDPDQADRLAHAAALKRDRLVPTLAKLHDKLSAAITSELHAKWLSDYRRVSPTSIAASVCNSPTCSAQARSELAF